MLELVVTLAITATVLAVLLPWVGSLLDRSTTELTDAATTRAATTIRTTVDTDLSRAVVCPATGTPVHTATSDTWALFTTADLDDPSTTDVHLVTWTLTGTTLARATTPADVGPTACGPTDPNVDPIGEPATVVWTSFPGPVQQVPAEAGEHTVVLFTPSPPAQPRTAHVALTVGPDIPIRGTWVLPHTPATLS